MERISFNMKCPLCLDEFEGVGHHFCNDRTHDPICTECVRGYIIHKVENGFMGYCPTMTCPCEHQDKKMKILDFSEWASSNIVTYDVVQKYKSLASSTLFFLCGGCHSLKSLQLEMSSKTTELGIKALREVFATYETRKTQSQLLQETRIQTVEEFLVRINEYCAGEVDVDPFFTEITQNVLPTLTHLTDKDSWELFKNILYCVRDPERQATLHLRYLRWRPRIWTPCCNREHCFRCRTKDFHEGQSCELNITKLDNSVLDCPGCGVYLVKGDGCNTITCVCGRQFSWATEKENMERCQNFVKYYPENTAECCVLVLVGQKISNMADARAWQSRHPLLVNKCLRQWFMQQYGNCPSQACAILGERPVPEGVREAIDMWIDQHSEEVNKCKRSNKQALRSIFETFYPDESHRGIDAAHLLRKTSFAEDGNAETTDVATPRLLASARLWVQENPDGYAKALEAIEERLTDQFLFLYRNQVPSIASLCQTHTPSVSQWNMPISNPALTFSNQGCSVQRLGNVSSYPAAFADLPAGCDRSMMRVRVDHCPRGPNWLTVGLAKKGHMPIASSDGVGRTMGTWGIHDDRSTYSGTAKVSYNGQDIDTCRKFMLGDIITCVVDVAEGWFEITLNEDDYKFRFTIPVGRSDEYVFAMTFANDHRVSIIGPDQEDISKQQQRQAGLGGVMGVDHTRMLIALKRHMRKIALGQQKGVDPSRIEAWANMFSDMYPDPAAARERLTQLRPVAYCLLDRQHLLPGFKASSRAEISDDEAIRQLKQGETGKVSAVTQTPTVDLNEKVLQAAIGALQGAPGVTWHELVYAICRDRIDSDKRIQLREVEEGMAFLATNGDSAPFLAAAALSSDLQLESVERAGAAVLTGDDSDEAMSSDSKTHRAALAFMKQFPDMMNEWYDYNARTREPMFGLEHVPRHCRCLPRHLDSCPYAVDSNSPSADDVASVTVTPFASPATESAVASASAPSENAPSAALPQLARK